MGEVINPIWFGLFTVTGPKQNETLHGNSGPCLWIAAQAEDAAKLRTRVEFVMQGLGLTVIEAEHLAEVQDEDDLSEAVGKLIPQAKRDVESVV
jgi:hypothetical protein